MERYNKVLDQDVVAEAVAAFEHPGNERFVLSCLLRNPDKYYDVDHKLAGGKAFLGEEHSRIFHIIGLAIRSGVSNLDLVTLLNIGQEVGFKVSGDYLNSIINTEASSTELDFYLHKLKEAYAKFQSYLALEVAAYDVRRNPHTGEDFKTADQLINEATESLINISLSTNISADAVDMGKFAVEHVRSIIEAPEKAFGIATGLSRLDKLLLGLKPGGLYVVAARPKVGKSMLLMNIAKYVAFFLGIPVLYIDTEMSEEEQALRLVSMMSGVPERMIINGSYQSNQEWVDQINKAFEVIKKGKLFFKQMPGFSIEDVKGLARKYYMKEGIGLVILDYIKLPDVGALATASETQLLGQTTMGLKDLASELKIASLAACQLGRAAEGRSKVSSGMIGETDRILRYVTALMAMCYKSQDELTQYDPKLYGTHRLQVLETRTGGTLVDGIDLCVYRNILTIQEAQCQMVDAAKFEAASQNA